MAFVGCFGSISKSCLLLQARAAHLCEPVLHLAFCDAFSLAYTTPQPPPAFPIPRFSVAADGGGADTPLNLSRLYLQYGRHLRRHIPTPLAFVLYDAKCGALLLGATGGRRFYFEEEGGAVWFSSDPALLRAPCAAELALIKK
ncbi:MAG: hypothetical protein IJV96_06715 [Clostridia bacterium]|nr:hypothetical protein [Clostridia bacterium]